jgi:hypothetical protein
MTLRRLKTYTAQTGYVYQYYFVGKRRALPNEIPGTEYVFDVSADRKTRFAVSVFVSDTATAAWSTSHRRPLRDPEEYAAAKLRLRLGFDEIQDMMAEGRRLAVEAPQLDRFLSGIGVD